MTCHKGKMEGSLFSSGMMDIFAQPKYFANKTTRRRIPIKGRKCLKDKSVFKKPTLFTTFEERKKMMM